MTTAPPGRQNILALVDGWFLDYGCPCPQSHLARVLKLERVHLQMLLGWLVSAGVLEWRASGLASSPDVTRAVKS